MNYNPENITCPICGENKCEIGRPNNKGFRYFHCRYRKRHLISKMGPDLKWIILGKHGMDLAKAYGDLVREHEKKSPAS